MTRSLMALGLYVGLTGFFAVNGIALLRGASLSTALLRGLAALALFAALGFVAGMATCVRADAPVEGEVDVDGQ